MFRKTALKQTKIKRNLVTMTVLLVSLGTSQQCNGKKEGETYFIIFARHYGISTTICWNSLFLPKNSKTNLVIAKIHKNTFIALRLTGILVSNAFFWYTDIGIHILRIINYKQHQNSYNAFLFEVHDCLWPSKISHGTYSLKPLHISIGPFLTAFYKNRHFTPRKYFTIAPYSPSYEYWLWILAMSILIENNSISTKLK